MASAAGFKQQCPSCEALVPIRDPDLVGRKIDCPKCKYRFVVEDPAGGDEKAGPAKAKKDDKGKKPQKGAKGKRREDDDDDKPSKSKGGSGGGSNKVLIGALVGGVAVVALIITGVVLFMGGDDAPAAGPKGGGGAGMVAAPKPQGDDEEKKPVVEDKPAASTAEMVTNLLPPETEGVCAVKLHNFIRSPMGNAVFAAPGTFLVGGLEKHLGFSPNDIDLFLQGWNFGSNWTINIIHSTKPLDKNAIVAALKLKAADAKIQDQEYFVADTNPWLDALGRAAFTKLVQTSPDRLTIRQGKLGARFYDDQTLVLADIAPLQAFLNAKGSFEYRKSVKPEEKKEEKEGTGSASEDQRGAAAAAMANKRNAMNGGMGLSTGSVNQGGGDAAAQKTEEKPKADEAKETVAYMTIQPALKAMLERLDAKQPILAIAVDSEAAKGKVAPLSTDPVGFDVVIKDAQTVGAAIVWKDHLTFFMDGEYGSEDSARRRFRDLEKKSGKELSNKMGRLLGVPVEFLNDGEEADPFDTQGPGGNAPGFGPGSQGRPGMTMPGGGTPGATMGGARGGRRGGAAGGAAGGGGMGAMAPGLAEDAPRRQGGRPGAPGFGPPGFGDPNAPPPPPKEPAKATARVDVRDRTLVMLTVEVIDESAIGALLGKIVRPAMIQEKGALDMAGSRSHIHELAAASQRLSEAMQRQFPRAAFDRPLPSSRAGRPYTPSQRVSWMVELLPYLGQGSLYGQINRDQSWRDPANVGSASTLIPQFLSPNTPPASWWVKYPDVADPVAATHFVGIAGVGLDAASYAANDPAVADKIGIFGYDRQTSARDITDGAANTILMAQVPSLVKRPWMAGGGSTAVGVPEKNSVKPFVSVQGNGKKGTLVVMADGTVRFISENVSDEVFKALSTIKGNESVILNREAPKVEPLPDELVEAPAQPATPAAPALPVPAEPLAPGENDDAGKEFVSKAGKFKVTFPAGKKQEQTISQDTPAGKINVFVIGVETKANESFSIIYNDFPPNLPIELSFDNELLVNGFRAGATAKVPGSKVVSEKKTKVAGKESLEMLIEVPGTGYLRDNIVFSGKRVYQVMVSGSQDFVTGKESDAFVKTFKFVP